MPIKRFGVSLEEDILKKLDDYTNDNHFPNRSQALRHLVENNSVEEKWQSNSEVAGAIVLVYDHHKREIDSKLNEVQHDYHHLILSSQHIHLSHDVCLETIAVKGKAKQLSQLADNLISLKGVINGKLVMTRAE